MIIEDDDIILVMNVNIDDAFDKPVLGYDQSQRKYEMWQNLSQWWSLHIP